MPVVQIPSKTAYADQILASEDLRAEARSIISTYRSDWAAEPRGALSRPERDAKLGVHATRGRELEHEALPAYLDGRKRMTPTSAVYRYLIDRVLASFPSDGPALKSRGSVHLKPRNPPAAKPYPKPRPNPVQEHVAAPASSPIAPRPGGRPRTKQPEPDGVTAE